MEERDLHYLKQDTKLNGRYLVKSVLGEGGFGITYFGVDNLFGNNVAIKEFFPQGLVTRNNELTNEVTVTYAKQGDAYAAGKKRFISEARVMAKFNKDQGIVGVTDFFESNNTAYIVMEYLDGITLKEYLQGNKRIPVEELLELISPLLESLDDVHSSGLIHRDISPDNIMVLKNGDVKLMDFGAARDYTEFGEKSLSIVLKPGYAPAEQYQSRGVQGPWTDIYALCATLYKCITGETPEDSIQRVMEDELKKPSEFGIDISPQVEKTILKGMSVSPKERYQNLREFCEDLYKDYVEDEVEEAGETKKTDSQEEIGTVIVEEEVQKEAKERKETEVSQQEKVSEKTEESKQQAATKKASENTKDEAGDTKKAADSKESVKSTEKKTSGSKKRILIAVIVCIIAAGGVGGYHFYQKSLEREVPNVVNVSYETAAAQAAGKDNSLKLVKSKEEYSDTVKKGNIISQDVKAGTILKKGDKINVVISKGALVTVPDVKNKKKKKAEELITQNKLVMSVSDKEWSDTVKKGNVISQDIAAGEKIEEGNTISVVISKGIEQVKVPDLEGKTLEEAKKVLTKAKLKTDSTSTYSDSVEEGKVISQSIEAGKTVDKNKTVTVTISLGKKPEPAYTAPSRSSGSSSRSSSHSSSSRSSSRKSSGSSKKKSSGGGSSLSKWNLVN